MSRYGRQFLHVNRKLRTIDKGKENFYVLPVFFYALEKDFFVFYF